MTDPNFYVNQVLPKLDIPIAEKYPLTSLMPTGHSHPLSEHTVFMLVALTGTGKTTTLNAVSKLAGDDFTSGMQVIPSRREVADWITIPTAQTILNEAIHHISDRVERFHYTRTFAEHVPGGQATSFSWVNVADDYQGMILSEGIRGENEIHHALNNFPAWHVIELALHPLTRLKRLSSRGQDFDKAAGDGDVVFLPDDLQAEAKQLVNDGEISAAALSITRAESASYGLYPFAAGDDYPNYHQVDVDDLTPEQVAEYVYAIIKESTHAND